MERAVRSFITIRIHKWDEVEVVVVKEGSDEVVFAIPVDELIGKVFDCHRRYPLASVCGAMPQDRLVFVFAVLAPEVDALLRTTFERLPRDENLRIGERVGEVIEVI